MLCSSGRQVISAHLLEQLASPSSRANDNGAVAMKTDPFAATVSCNSIECPLPTHGNYASAPGPRPVYFFFRRALRPFRAPSALSIANSSSLRPCLTRADSQRGRAPRPAHVSPPGPRYLGGTLRPFSAERRPSPVREFLAAPPLSAPRRESCFSSSLRF